MSAPLASLPSAASTAPAPVSVRGGGRANTAATGDFSASLADATSAVDAKTIVPDAKQGAVAGEGQIQADVSSKAAATGEAVPPAGAAIEASKVTQPAQILAALQALQRKGPQPATSEAKPPSAKSAVAVVAGDSAVPVSSIPDAGDTAITTPLAATISVPGVQAIKPATTGAAHTEVDPIAAGATFPGETDSEIVTPPATAPDMALPLMLLVTVPPPPAAAQTAATGVGTPAPTGVATAKAVPSTAINNSVQTGPVGGDLTPIAAQAATAASSAPASAARPVGTQVAATSNIAQTGAAVAQDATAIPAQAAPSARPASAPMSASTVPVTGTATELALAKAADSSVAAAAAPALPAAVAALARAFAAAPQQEPAPMPAEAATAPDAVAMGKIAQATLSATPTQTIATPARGTAGRPATSQTGVAGKASSPAPASDGSDTIDAITTRAPAARASASGTVTATGAGTQHTGVQAAASELVAPSAITAPVEPTVTLDPTVTPALPQQPALPNVATATMTATTEAAAATAAMPIPVVHDVALGSVPVEVGMKSLAGINHFEIRLAPNDLGAVEVKLQIDEDGRVKAHLTVDRPETLGFLQRDTGQLQQALEQAGLKTQPGSIAMTLRDPSTDTGTGAGQNRNQNSDQQQQQGGSGQSGRPTDATRPAAIRPAMQSRNVTWTRSSGVDRHI